MNNNNPLESSADSLREFGLPGDLVDQLIESGYVVRRVANWNGGDPRLSLADSFYGSKEYISLIPFEAIESTISNPPIRVTIRELEIQSLEHAKELLATKPQSQYIAAGAMSFRGQVQEYHTKRRLPNMRVASENGLERLIIPAIWRPFASSWNSRFDYQAPPPFFSTILADPIVYHGIPDWETLSERNFQRYGLHTLSNLEDFPDEESQVYGQRWRRHKVEGPFDFEMPALEQHYGMPTSGLDVTFDLRVALFFATHVFSSRPDGTSTFEPVPENLRNGVVYCVVFRDPRLVETADRLEMNSLFQHVPPERPRRQHCSLPHFGPLNMNEAVADLDTVFRISSSFDMSGLPTAEELFPLEEQDEFYRVLMQLRARFGEDSDYSAFPRYRFD